MKKKAYVQVGVRMPPETKRMLDWIAAEKVRRENIDLGRLRGYRSKLVAELIDREYERMKREEPI